MVEVTKVNDSRVKNFISFQSHFLVTLKTSLLLKQSSKLGECALQVFLLPSSSLPSPF